ncbi:WD40 repeat-like protein [Hyaloscypha bicolor E]|uniref:WD40 repeat-like protein n=1 Tax=Hyaloscypha bicolor E TaxID=1095630 RepID=A0A2J6SMW3_9HELO|nr:WD40 repeat-like protein [Hyaloscypha bicolor E]PMD52098.1 WD40 repeat-like protein [Hyaloscypha bicolor E]
MSMITATAWVPRGFAAPFPTKYTFDEDEFARIAELAKIQLDDANEDLEDARKEAADSNGAEDMKEEDGSDDEAPSKTLKSKADEDDDLQEYDLEHYDDDVEKDKEDEGMGMGMFGNVKSLAYHASNEDDPYITMKENEEEDEDREELQILATDNLLLAAKVEDEVAHLEVYVYEDEADNLYVHHDIMLPAIPLCVEWLDLPVGKSNVEKDSRANFVAVGTFDPDIEIWDLDTIDCMYPNAILGQGGDTGSDGLKKKEKKKKKKSKKANVEFHVDAVLSLAANRHHRNLLASSSADKTVKLWDLNTTKCAKSYTHHTDKVCSIAWHPKESTVLLSGSYDRTVVAADMRAPDAKVPSWGVESDVETVRWDPHDPNFFYISTENGIIHYHDVRKAPASPAASKPVWILQAHDESVSAFDINPVIPGFMATGSTDKQVKLWNIQPSGPSMVVSRDLDVGKVFSTVFAPDEEVGFRLAVAGSKGMMQIWDTSTNPAVRRAFASRVAPVEGEIKERLVGVGEDSSESEEEEGGVETGEANGGEGWESMDED